MLEYDEAQHKLTLERALDKPAEERRFATYGALLTCNFLSARSGGVKTALDEPNGNVVQMFEINATDLDLDTLQTVLGTFADSSFPKGQVSTKAGQLQAVSNFSQYSTGGSS